MSISNNIAEGFERGTTSELIHYLYIARGSAGEVRSMLSVMERMASFDVLKTDISNTKGTCESLSRQIRGWTNSLQNSEIEGQRYLNDQSRFKYDSRMRKISAHDEHRRWQAEFEEKLKAKAIAQNEKAESQLKNEAEEEI